MRRAFLVALAFAAAAANAGRVRAECAAQGEARIAELLREGRAVDAHHLAEALTVLCPEVGARARRLDAVALIRLGEPGRAGAILTPPPPGDEAAAVLVAWAHREAGDVGAFTAALATLPPEAKARLTARAAAGGDGFDGAARALQPELAARARRLHGKHLDSRVRRPWLAGSLSALLPGLGQVYAGSWDGAAVAFVLNAVLIGATVELARHDLPFSAATTGLAASVFYVGNIVNAADLADRRNLEAARGVAAELDCLLIAEMCP